MVSAFLNTVKIPELRRRILFTLAIVVVVRLGAAITTPGVNQAVLQEWFRSALTEKSGGNLAALLNLFSGGALENCAIFSLGIMPYISASIMMQLLSAVISLTTGTLMLMWLGDQITERGIGNGISLIITIGIVARLPAALAQAWKTFVPSGGQSSQVNPMVLVLMILFLFCVIAGVIAITQGVRKITVQYAKRVVGRKQYGGNTQYMPLKVNYPGVMPIIFAWALLLFPNQIVSWAFPNSPTARQLSEMLSTGWLHYVVLAAMIFFFSYFWVATQFQPSQIADDLKKYGGYIPGVRPGKPTAEFLDFTMTRLTFAGAVFLTGIALLPSLLRQGLHVATVAAPFFGGTSLLIIVGVMLDTMRQVETHLIQRHYDGFLRKGRVRGGFTGRSAYVRGEAAAQRTLMWLYVGIAIIVIGGVAAFLASK